MKYSEYDTECIVYLAVEIPKMLLLEQNFMYIDMYYQAIKEIYEDYKKHDNKNMSLLTSVHKYINDNEQELLDRLKGIIEY